MSTNIVRKLDAGWYVFYAWKKKLEAGVRMIKIDADCLDDAIAVAKKIAKRSDIYLIGIPPAFEEKEGAVLSVGFFRSKFADLPGAGIWEDRTESDDELLEQLGGDW